MVKIAKKDFNKELRSYIDKRRVKERSGKGFGFKMSFAKKKITEKIPDIGPTEVHVEYKQPGFFSKLFSFRRGLIKEAGSSEELSPEEMAKLRAMEDDIEDTEKEIVEKEQEMKEMKNEEAELIEKREGLLTNFFSKINIFKRTRMKTVEMPDEGEGPVLDEDIAETFKIIHKWLEQLTPAKKRSFKASSDFQKYKEVLEKYGLVRKR